MPKNPIYVIVIILIAFITALGGAPGAGTPAGGNPAGAASGDNPAGTAPVRPDGDQRLVGSWGYFGDRSAPELYIFNSDGTFMYYFAMFECDDDMTPYIATEAVFRGKYNLVGSVLFLNDASYVRYNLLGDEEAMNLIGDRKHAKEVLEELSADFSDFTELTASTPAPREIEFVGDGLLNICYDPEDGFTEFRADWESYGGW